MRKSVFRSLESRQKLEARYNDGASVRELKETFHCSDFPIYKEIRRGTIGYIGNRPVYYV